MFASSTPPVELDQEKIATHSSTISEKFWIH